MMENAGSVQGFTTSETAWCPGCGNFSILPCLRQALTELGLDPHSVLMVAGIGQAAKTPQYINTHSFCGLHGRALPPALAAKIANEDLTVIIETGDGDSYGEGGNHFIHAIRRNVDVTHFVHDNQIYGLTKGQASPTTQEGHVTDVQTLGNLNIPLNPILLALAAGAGFVARAFSGNQTQLVAIMKQAIQFRGYALVDILQPCVSFNKVNTFADTSHRVQPLPGDYDPTDRAAAFQMAMASGDKIPTGVIYRVESPTFHQKHRLLASGGPLLSRPYDAQAVRDAISEFI
jgi:2-oxoglutarate/2-oxoacid ferredoxin oxidoreductase subunit beta